MSRAGRKQRLRAKRQARAHRRIERETRRGSAAGRPSNPELRPEAEPICGVEPIRIDPALDWYIARLLPRLGDKALEALRKAEVARFQPRTSEVVVRRGRRVVRNAQLMLRTVFIGVRDAVHLDEARGVPGLAEIVSYPEAEAEGALKGNVVGMVMKPARLDPIALQDFADAVAKGEIVAPIGVIKGSNVIVLTGPFASFPAVVEEILPGDRFKLGISIFGRSTPVQLGLADIQLV